MGHTSVKNDIASLQHACSALLQWSGMDEGGQGEKAGFRTVLTMHNGVIEEAAKGRGMVRQEMVDERGDVEWETGSNGDGSLVRVASPPGANDNADDNDTITTAFTIPVGNMQVLGHLSGPQHETNHTGHVAGGTLQSS